jgi:hypothetical protein
VKFRRQLNVSKSFATQNYSRAGTVACSNCKDEKPKSGSYQRFIARRGRRATAVKRLEIREILGTKTMREITLK